MLLIGGFIVLDIIMYYVCYEGSLIPMLLLIGRYGKRKEKIEAAYKIFLMTLAGSLIMLIAILIIYSETGSSDYILISEMKIATSRQQYLWIGLFISFAIKTPIILLKRIMMLRGLTKRRRAKETEEKILQIHQRRV